MLECSCRTGDKASTLSGFSILPLFKTLLNPLFPVTSSYLLVTIYYLTPFTHPLLSTTVLQVIDVLIFPVEADAQQIYGLKTILGQDYKVGKESSYSLDHPYEW